jgi:hypothetical protein
MAVATGNHLRGSAGIFPAIVFFFDKIEEIDIDIAQRIATRGRCLT